MQTSQMESVRHFQYVLSVASHGRRLQGGSLRLPCDWRSVSLASTLPPPPSPRLGNRNYTLLL